MVPVGVMGRQSQNPVHVGAILLIPCVANVNRQPGDVQSHIIRQNSASGVANKANPRASLCMIYGKVVTTLISI